MLNWVSGFLTFTNFSFLKSEGMRLLSVNIVGQGIGAMKRGVSSQGLHLLFSSFWTVTRSQEDF